MTDNTESGDIIQLDVISDEIQIREQELKETVATEILSLLRLSVISTWTAIGVVFCVDSIFLYSSVIESSARLVSEAVLMSVIGATVVQVGAAAIAIVSAQFKSNSSENVPS